jgi:hypothetical protein
MPLPSPLIGSARTPLSNGRRTRASREPPTEAAAVALGRRLVFTLTERNFTTPGPQRRGSQAPPILSSAGEGRSPRRSRGLRSHDHAVRRLMWGPACGGAADIGSPRPRATHYLRWQLIRMEKSQRNPPTGASRRCEAPGWRASFDARQSGLQALRASQSCTGTARLRGSGP